MCDAGFFTVGVCGVCQDGVNGDICVPSTCSVICENVPSCNAFVYDTVAKECHFQSVSAAVFATLVGAPPDRHPGLQYWYKADSFGRRLLAFYGDWPNHKYAKDLYLEEDAATIQAMRTAIGTTPMQKWAGCSQRQVFSETTVIPPLPCRTGASAQSCVDGERRCGTLYENSYEPFIEFEINEVPLHYYFFALEFTLPDNADFGPLLFQGYYETGGRGYQVTVTDAHKLPLRVGCLPWGEQIVTFWAQGLRKVQHRCAKVLASDEDLEELSKVRHVRITLPGADRQLWVDRVRIIYRNHEDKPPSPPLPPPSPQLPPQPKAPPDMPAPAAVSCFTYANLKWAIPEKATVLFQEPCGQSFENCCRLAHDFNATGFALSAAGCCDLLEVLTEDDPTVVFDNGNAVSGRVVVR